MDLPASIVATVNRYAVLLARVAALIAVIGMVSGCGGVSGSHSVSPGSFFLPGLIRTEPPPGKEPERAKELPGDQPIPLNAEPDKALAG